ncbi:MAG: hypothetical protein RL150_349 [Candidatus Parcubacteria bacterium]|jgi:hypothetical protein
MRTVQIVKGNGDRESFDPDKLRQSLLRAHATTIAAEAVVDAITKEIRAGMSTGDIYRRAFTLLSSTEHSAALTYSIRRSVLNLGPTGFPFERYIAELLAEQGYKTRTGQHIQGRCIEHEVDVVAWNNEQLLFAEVKFHNELTMKSDTKTALYVKARFDDLYDHTHRIEGKERTLTRGMLITNTKFTQGAKEYASCVGTFDMISWDYPEHGNLYDMIAQTGLHPMTCLPSLSEHDKRELLKRGILHCKTLQEDPSIMRSIGLPDTAIETVVRDVEQLRKPKRSHDL